ncbi:TonB family protein [Hyalangium versicolor]|uniref:TonB family protein n=1 Tax=Hyalangium versicolor TaxID=2861190 RepID=UPI001CC90796|nr:TonB family protein [Hyalangium versicolor]
MRQEGVAQGRLFASVLDARLSQVERRARLLRVGPFILVLHVLAIVVLERDPRSAIHLPVRAGEDDAPILRLLPAPPSLPSTVAPPSAPVRVVSRRVVTRDVPPRPMSVPLPPRAPEAPEPLPPPDSSPPASEVPASALGSAAADEASPGDALDEAPGSTVAGVAGGLVGAVLASGAVAPPPTLTPEERDELVERYMEKLIRDRFMFVRYPHLAAAAGITGQVTLNVSISSQGRLLKLELVGRCPHPVLCDAAQETVRNAQPFPPPPPELGNPFLLELPFRYHL